MLTEFFAMNLSSDFARTLNLLYVEFPCHFVWCKSNKSWKPRKQLTVIGRLVAINPTKGERYYLRLLLMNVRAPTSFGCLRTVNGQITSSFRDAAEKLGLLAGDFIVEESLNEAVLFQMPSSLWTFFATLLIFCDISNPISLWMKYKTHMCQDLLRTGLHTNAEAESLVLKMIANIVQEMGKKTKDFCLFDLLESYDFPERVINEILHEKNLPVSEADLLAIHKLNACQRATFKTITDVVLGNKPSAFFVDGPGGTGKTFLYRCLLAFVRSKSLIALATATSGIAASILPGGRTAHSRFKLPLDGTDKYVCNIGKHTADASLLRHSKLILWGEASIAHRNIVESLDITLKDIMDCQDLFGGKVIVFGGDFRQTLPVVRHGKKEDFIAASLVKSTSIWSHICRLTLVENMRAHADPTFASYLMKIGIMAIVIYKLPRQIVVTKNGEQNVHDFVVMNEELKPIILTLWRTFAVNQGVQLELQLRQGKFPIILAEGLNVNAFQGLSLSTLYNTSIEVDPVAHGAKVLNDWKDKNSELIYKEIVDKTYLDSLLTLADPIRQRKACLSSLEIEFEQKPIAWVRGKIRLLKSDGFDYYVGCNYCNKIVHSTEGLQLHCMNCG
nr:ATP-dependent DNA helicase PIF1-like [Ipomoea batatas]